MSYMTKERQDRKQIVLQYVADHPIGGVGLKRLLNLLVSDHRIRVSVMVLKRYIDELMISGAIELKDGKYHVGGR